MPTKAGRGNGWVDGWMSSSMQKVDDPVSEQYIQCTHAFWHTIASRGAPGDLMKMKPS